MKAVVKGFSVIIVGLLASLSAVADAPFFTVSENRTAYVQNAQKEALVRDKLLLLVVGANWCHDSRALGGYLQEDDVQPALSSYVLAKVDAAWLDNLTALLSPYGHPAYFGTPSLMIINPETNQLLNRGSIQRWQSAHNESPQALATYLSDHAKRNNKAITAPSESLQAFEADQARRLYAAYAVLGELLAEEESGDSANSDTLNEYWREVATFRHQLQKDLTQLHARQQDTELNFPEYPPLSFL